MLDDVSCSRIGFDGIELTSKVTVMSKPLLTVAEGRDKTTELKVNMATKPAELKSCILEEVMCFGLVEALVY